MISLSTITSFKGTGSVLLDANGTGLESVGFKQQLKSFFNVGDAQDKNRELLRAIRTAIRVDNRFSSTDIQDHADRLFAEVRTDRAIDVSRLKGIVQELEKLALVSGSNIGKRVDLHVAAGDYTAVGLSDFIDKHADQVAFVAKQRADKVADDTQTAAIVANATADVRYVPVDVAGCVMDAAMNCQAVLDAVSNVPDANTRDLVDFVAKHLGQLVLKNDAAQRPNTFRTPSEIADIGRFCAQASRGGHAWIHESNPIGSISGEPELVKPYEMAAMEFLAAVGKPVPPSLYDTIDQMARGFLTDPQLSNSFSTAVRRQDHSMANIKRLLAGDAMKMYSAIKGHAGFRAFCTDTLGTDVKALEALGRYVAKLVALRLSDGVKNALRRELLAQAAIVDLTDFEEQQVKPVCVALEAAVRDAIMQDLY